MHWKKTSLNIYLCLSLCTSVPSEHDIAPGWPGCTAASSLGFPQVGCWEEQEEGDGGGPPNAAGPFRAAGLETSTESPGKPWSPAVPQCVCSSLIASRASDELERVNKCHKDTSRHGLENKWPYILFQANQLCSLALSIHPQVYRHAVIFRGLQF